MEKIALCPGTYDPLTEGHKDIISRCSKIFHKVVVAILISTRKKTLYTTKKRVYFAKKALKNLNNVEVITFEGLLVDLAKKVKATVIIKGLRAISDFEYEFQMAMMNHRLKPKLETFFMMTGESAF